MRGFIMNEQNYSESIANAINNFLVEDDWHFSFDDQCGIFKFELRMKGNVKKINYVIDVQEDSYLVYAFSPIGADPEDEKIMSSMAEFACRANYGLKNGNFEIGMEDGEIRFKSFVDCEGTMPTLEVLKNSIYCPAAMYARYGMAILDIIFKNSTAKEAIDECMSR
jgi:hypothetical protein